MRKDSDGLELLRITLAQSGTGHTGEVHFMRGKDLLSRDYENSGPNGEVEDSFLVQDHPNDGSWDEMIYLMSASAGGGGSTITMTLRDHTSYPFLKDSGARIVRIWNLGDHSSPVENTLLQPVSQVRLTA